MDTLSLLHMVFGSIFVLFVPGFAWTFVSFKKHEIDMVERVTLSFGISLALVPLSLFYLNYLLHVKVTTLNAFIIVSILTIIPIVYLYLQKTGKIQTIRSFWKYKQK